MYMHGTGSWTNATCGATAGIERIYTFTPNMTGTHQLQVTSATAPSPGIRYSQTGIPGCDANNWNCLGTATNLNTYSFNLTAGVPIYILAQAVATDAMWHKIVLHCAVPQNQSCATAEPVGSYPATINANAQLGSSALSASCFSAAKPHPLVQSHGRVRWHVGQHVRDRYEYGAGRTAEVAEASPKWRATTTRPPGPAPAQQSHKDLGIAGWHRLLHRCRGRFWFTAHERGAQRFHHAHRW
ncbi:MAG: hypothetical protein IPJ85_11310 [Flavobacteriales bacterium]|nr:hypothetical protein [Flavobacteriales bacterium]